MKRELSPNSRRGFTIVELLIVIVVIAILAAVTVVGYGGIQRRTVASVQQNDLRSVSKHLALLRTEEVISYRNPSLWKQALINAKMYDAVTPTDGKTKSMLMCANDEHYVLGGWEPVNDKEENTVDAYYIYDGAMRSFKWDHATVGSSTLEKFCRQVSAIHGLDLYTQTIATRMWMHNPLIREAEAL